MHIVTFYSFKGGVGRTLALVNVALELARTGRRVLVVDFDLEAPGIDTFGLLAPKEPHHGIVEYVTEYMEKRVAPDVREYVYEVSEVGQKGGRLWVMPAGSGDEEYSRKLSNIDWQKLYDEHNGFLMVEDLKVQWETYFQPDYVLIDSRTGYTDVAGICTRQLPNAVVILFFPNKQNLNGLKPIVSCICDENKKEERNIKLHFVMSNVPDLDDEDGILVGLQRQFREELKYEELCCVIHRYDSLRLLNQALFVFERPRSRLAKEYRVLADAITEENFEDRQAVVRKLTTKQIFRFRERTKESPSKFADKILKYHGRDGQIVYLLAVEMKQRGMLEQSEMLVKKSLELGYRSPEALLAEAEVSLRDTDKGTVQACNAVLEAFESNDIRDDVLTRGIEILRRIAPERLLDLPKTSAFKKLSMHEVLWVTFELIYCKEGLEAALKLLLPYQENTSITVENARSVRLALCTTLIGLSRFDQAMRLFGSTRPAPEDLEIDDCFNYAIAEWGRTGIPHKDMFEHVVRLDKNEEGKNGANYNQCLAIALWVVEEKQQSLKRLDIAISSIRELPKADFSCWRYMQVSPEEFEKDCGDIRRLVNGEKVKPIFMPGEA